MRRKITSQANWQWQYSITEMNFTFNILKRIVFMISDRMLRNRRDFRHNRFSTVRCTNPIQSFWILIWSREKKSTNSISTEWKFNMNKYVLRKQLKIYPALKTSSWNVNVRVGFYCMLYLRNSIPSYHLASTAHSPQIPVFPFKLCSRGRKSTKVDKRLCRG